MLVLAWLRRYVMASHRGGVGAVSKRKIGGQMREEDARTFMAQMNGSYFEAYVSRTYFLQPLSRTCSLPLFFLLCLLLNVVKPCLRRLSLWKFRLGYPSINTLIVGTFLLLMAYDSIAMFAFPKFKKPRSIDIYPFPFGTPIRSKPNISRNLDNLFGKSFILLLRWE